MFYSISASTPGNQGYVSGWFIRTVLFCLAAMKDTGIGQSNIIYIRFYSVGGRTTGK